MFFICFINKYTLHSKNATFSLNLQINFLLFYKKTHNANSSISNRFLESIAIEEIYSFYSNLYSNYCTLTGPPEGPLRDLGKVL